MKISLDGRELIVSDEQRMQVLGMLSNFALEKYDSLPPDMRFIAKPIARKILQDQENKTRATHSKEVSLIFRPDKKEDAVVHLTKVTVLLLQELLKNVEISISTDADTITNISYVTHTGEGGG